MDEAYIGTIVLWAGSWVPRNWALCDGTQLNIMDYQALYSLIGVRYGGDARTTFNLPDLRNRVPMGLQAASQMPGATGAASQVLTVTGSATGVIAANQLPPMSGKASVSIPANNAPVAANLTDVPGPNAVLAKGVASNFSAKIYTSDAANTNLKPFDAPVTISQGSPQQPLSLPVSLSGQVSTLQPSLTLNFIICLLGLYPDRP
ncbi:tail fiber protein [Paracidovorax citrulli]|uniref:Phage Tail Collar domain protein n=2 Tax=Paracidovorax citrulli TaxID=80869 RepID=A1TUY8_PARC0|nr:tail fiber protein [Paracidovorax citrulli]ABM34776.1 phage Tail Collar domain protein [Paracidovorax citrulli AAC00-1]ATG96651.1 phage tail protein [Paracidovorax citrulli]MVT28691.1 phage tail protein [Paracidovorax citrulli]MVT37441.1 phage tail protein [Paracidovorax citrulli]PVY64223.1 microcystin-dependent protein [Paracidovorax citrulli]